MFLRVCFVVFALVVALPCAGGTPEDDDAKPLPLLIEPAELINRETGRVAVELNPILLDVRPLDARQRANIPGSRHIDAGQWTAAFGDGTDAEAWTRRLALIVDADRPVVVYDETFSPTAARMWWILKYWGVEDVRILNGGLRAWQAEGGLVADQGTRFSMPPGPFQAVPHPERLATYEQVRELADQTNHTVCLVDTRSDREVAAGHIATSRHLDWQELVGPKTGKLRSPEELESLLARVNFNPESRAVTYCRSGGRASVVAFAMELVGGNPAANYHGSWNEWSKMQQTGR